MKKELLYFSIPLMLSGGLTILMNNFDTFMVGYFLSSTQVGIYNIAYKMAGFILMPLSFVGFIYFPLSSKLLSDGKKSQVTKLLPFFNKWGTALVVPIIFLFLAFPSKTISIFFGQEYVPAALSLQLITIGYLPHLLNGKTGETLKAGGHTKILLWTALAATVTNLSLNMLLIPRFGIEGAAMATGASFFLMGAIYILSIKKLMQISPFSEKYILSCVLALLSGVLIAVIHEMLFTSLGIVGLLFSLVLFVGLFLSLNIITRNFEEEDLLVIEIIEDRTGLNLKWLKGILFKRGSKDG